MKILMVVLVIWISTDVTQGEDGVGRCYSTRWNTIFQTRTCEKRFGTACVPFNDAPCGWGREYMHYTCTSRGEVFCNQYCWVHCDGDELDNCEDRDTSSCNIPRRSACSVIEGLGKHVIKYNKCDDGPAFECQADCCCKRHPTLDIVQSGLCNPGNTVPPNDRRYACPFTKFDD